MSIFTAQKDEFGITSGILGPFDIGVMKSRRTTEREFLLKQAETDYQGLQKFQEYLTAHKGETYFDKLPELMYGCSEEAIDFAKNFDRSVDSIDAFVEAQKKSAIESTKFSTKLKGLGKTAVGLGKSLAATGLNMLAMFAVTKTVELIANAWDQYTNRVDYANEALAELGEKWDDISTKQTDAQKVMSQYAESYDRLSKGVNTQTGENISLSDSEYQQYLETNNAIANSALANIEGVTIAYDEQGNALVRLTGSTQTLADAYDMLAQKTRDEILSSEVMKNWNTSVEADLKNYNQAEKAVKVLESSLSNPGEYSRDTIEIQMANMGIDAQELFDQFVAEGNTNFDDAKLFDYYLQHVTRMRDEIKNELPKSIDKTLDLPRRLASTVVEDEFANNPDLYGGLSDTIQKALAQTINNLDYTYFVGKSDQELKDAVQKDFIAPLEHASAQTALGTMFDTQSAFQANKLSWGAYKKSGTDAINALEALGVDKDYIEALREQMGLDDKSVYDKYYSHLEAIVEDEDKAWLDNMSRAQLEFANGLDSNTRYSKAEFDKAWTRSQEEEAYSVDAITTEYNALIEAQNKALEIQKEIGTAGAMTAEQYKELIAMSPDYAEAISGETGYLTVDSDKLRQINQKKLGEQKTKVNEALALNEKQMDEESKHLAELLKEYENYGANDEAMRSNIMAAIIDSQSLCESYKSQRRELEALNNELSFATSSYKRWLDAQDAAEKSDAFKGAKSAIEAIREGDESGRRNTEKYKAAEEYILGKDAARMSKEARETALKRAESFYDEDGNFALDAWRKASLEAGAQRKDGTWAVGSIDEYAKMLGLSREYTAQAVLALSEYNGSYGVNVSQALIDQAQELLPKTEVESNTDAILKLTDELIALTNAITGEENGVQTTTGTEETPTESNSALALFKQFVASGKDQAKTKAQNIGNKGKELWGSFINFIKPYIGDEKDKRNAELRSSVANPTDLIANDQAASQSVTTATEQIDALSGAAKTAAEELNKLAPQDETPAYTEDELQNAFVNAWIRASKESGDPVFSKDEQAIVDFFEKTSPETVKQASAYGKEQLNLFSADQATLDALYEELKIIEETPVEAPIEANTEEALTKVEELNEAASAPVEKKVTVTIDPITGLTYESDEFDSFASGTQNAPGGASLVGEEEPEIVVNKKKGKWFLAKGPQLVNLNKGDIVYNGKQTKSILRGRGATGGNSYARGTIVKDWQLGKALIDETTISNGATETPKKPGKGKSSGKNYNAILETFAGLYDWIQRALEVAQKKTQQLIDSVKDYVGYIAQNNTLDKAIAATIKERQQNEAGYLRYMQQAEEVRKQTDLSSDLVTRIQNGTIDINEYDDTTKKKIEEYQRWYELAEQCKDTIEELKDQERELQMQKLDNIIADYENRLDVLADKAQKEQSEIELRQARGIELQEENYRRLIANSEQQLAVLTKERETLEAELLTQVASGIIKENSDEWHKYRNELEDIDSSIVDCQISMVEFGDAIYQLRIDNLANTLGLLQQTQSATESLMSLHDAQGTDNVEGYYQVLIGNGFKQIENLKEQNELLLEQSRGMDVNSEKYQKVLDQIESNEDAIANLKIAQEQWNDSIADLKIDTLEKEKEKLQEVNDEYQRQLEYEEALEALAKAKNQRTKLVFRDGIGFRYEADQDAIDEAQKRLDDLDLQARIDAIDKQVEAIEDNKANSNVYDYTGQSLANGLEIGSSAFNEMINQMVNAPVEQGMAGMAVAAKTTELSGGGRSINMSIGDINITDAENSEALARDIVTRLPNQIIQELYKK